MGNTSSFEKIKLIDFFVNKSCKKCIIKKYRYHDFLLEYEKKYKKEIKKIIVYHDQINKIIEEIVKSYKNFIKLSKKERENYRKMKTKKNKLIDKCLILQISLCQKIIKMKKYFEILNEYILCMKNKCSKFYNEYIQQIVILYSNMSFVLKFSQTSKNKQENTEKNTKKRIKYIRNIVNLIKKLMKNLKIDIKKIDKNVDIRIKKLLQLIKKSAKTMLEKKMNKNK